MVTKWTESGPEVPSNLPSVRPERSFVREQILRTSIFLVNYNCDASYDHLWWPKGPEVDRKCHQTFRLSVQKWTGSVRLSVCPSQTLPLPPWWTLCEGTTSAGRLRPANFLVFSPHPNSCSRVMHLFKTLRFCNFSIRSYCSLFMNSIKQNKWDNPLW